MSEAWQACATSRLTLDARLCRRCWSSRGVRHPPDGRRAMTRRVVALVLILPILPAACSADRGAATESMLGRAATPVSAPQPGQPPIPLPSMGQAPGAPLPPSEASAVRSGSGY